MIVYDRILNTLYKTSIKLSIKPQSLHGLLLYSGQLEKDFISIGLSNGFVIFQFDLGSGPAFIKSEQKIRTNEWVTVTAPRSRIAAPSATICSARARSNGEASSPCSSSRPPSENESSVRLSTPITCGRARDRRADPALSTGTDRFTTGVDPKRGSDVRSGTSDVFGRATDRS